MRRAVHDSISARRPDLSLSAVALCLLATSASACAGSDAADAGGATSGLPFTTAGDGGADPEQPGADGGAMPGDGAVGTTGSSDAAAGSTTSRDAAAEADARVDTDAAPDAARPPPPVPCAELTKDYPRDPGATPYPGGTWSLPEPSYGMAIESNVEIEMSDGVVLVGDVAYPTDLDTGERAAGEFPILLTQNPYTAAAFGAGSGEIFVTRGYLYASIDVRGSGRSPGEAGLFTPRQAKDGAELVAWAAQLEGADGRVGLHGCSQLGINQLETATQLGPDSPVKAMIPACGSGDFYRDTAFDNGIPTLVGFALAGDAATNGGDMTLYRDFWQAADRVARAGAIAETGIPALFWSGWHEPGALGSLELYTALQNLAAGRPASAAITTGMEVSGKYQVILGDWGHASGLDQGIQLQWYDTWIKGLDTGLPVDTDTPLHLSELGGSERWVNARCYPLTESYTAMYLSDAGGLTTDASGAETQAALDWVAPGQTSDALEFRSAPLSDGAMLAGPAAARLSVTSDNANAQLVVDIFDEAPDGTRAQITHGSVLGSLRRIDAEKSWNDQAGLPARPRLTLDAHQPLTPGERTDLQVPLWPSVWSFEPGHRIVVRILTQPDSADCGGVFGVPVGCNPTTPMQQSLEGGSYTVHLGGDAASLVSLPLLEHGALPTSRSAVSPTGEIDPAAELLGLVEYPLPVDW